MLTPWKRLPLKEIGVLVTEKAKGWGMYLAVDPLRSSEASEQRRSGRVADKGRGVSREGGSEAVGLRILVSKGSFPSGRTTCVVQRETRPRTPRGVTGREEGPRAGQCPGCRDPSRLGLGGREELAPVGGSHCIHH